MANKYIINDKVIKMSDKVDYHKELADDHTTTRGGGWWFIYNNKMYLYDTSQDFGNVNIDELKEAVNNTPELNEYEVLYYNHYSLGVVVQKAIKIKDAGESK